MALLGLTVVSETDYNQITTQIKILHGQLVSHGNRKWSMTSAEGRKGLGPSQEGGTYSTPFSWGKARTRGHFTDESHVDSVGEGSLSQGADTIRPGACVCVHACTYIYVHARVFTCLFIGDV